jgi:hypothetical protein
MIDERSDVDIERRGVWWGIEAIHHIALNGGFRQLIIHHGVLVRLTRDKSRCAGTLTTGDFVFESKVVSGKL